MPQRLTIAIPTYNRAGLLKAALESALAQTSQDIQILVSDNGSTDGTAELLAGYNDPRLRKIRRETTLPRAEHGTYVFGLVETELVLILSDDDWIEPEFSSEVTGLFKAHPEISFAYTGCIEHYDDAELPALVGPRMESPLEFFKAHYAGQRQVSWCACVTRVADIRACGPQPPDRMIGDMFFWTKIAFKGPVGCVPRPLAHYSVLRPGGDNESRTLPILAWGDEVQLLAQEVLAGLERTGISVMEKTALRKSMQDYTTRSVANQFLWGRVSGMSRGICVRLVLPSMRYRGWNVKNLVRMAAAIILPRKLLRKMTVAAAEKIARTRTV